MLPPRPVSLAAASAALLLGCVAPARADVAFRVRIDPAVRAEPASGRLVVYLIKDGAAVGHADPADAPFFDDPQPMFGVDVKDVKPGEWITLSDAAMRPAEGGALKDARPRWFPAPIAELPPGRYRVQAVLDAARLDSSWKREPGNLFSAVQVCTVPPPGTPAGPTVDISLARAVTPGDLTPPAPPGLGVEYVTVRSELLSRFRGTDVFLNAGVVLPLDYDPARPRGGGGGGYAAVYDIPGFGGDHRAAAGQAAQRRRLKGDSPAALLARHTFWIVLDPEGPNGHHLFANSANNGPVADALITELLPALDAKYNLAKTPAARLLRGHSSGGWATLWLATQYPGTFGAAWSSSPDPVDFSRFQRIDLYSGANAYTAAGAPVPSYRTAAGVKMTVAQENAMEEVIGPDNTSGQQWDSWFAVFGPRSERGTPAPLWDAATGAINHVVAEQYKPFDIVALLRKNPAALGPIFKQRIRLYVGDQDNYYLNEAVASLAPAVDALNFFSLPEGSHGFITIILGKDHGSIFASKELQAIPADMVEHLKRNSLLK